MSGRAARVDPCDLQRAQEADERGERQKNRLAAALVEAADAGEAALVLRFLRGVDRFALVRSDVGGLGGQGGAARGGDEASLRRTVVGFGRAERRPARDSAGARLDQYVVVGRRRCGARRPGFDAGLRHFALEPRESGGGADGRALHRRSRRRRLGDRRGGTDDRRRGRGRRMDDGRRAPGVADVAFERGEPIDDAFERGVHGLQGRMGALIGLVLHGAQIGDLAADFAMADRTDVRERLTDRVARGGASGFLGGFERGGPRLVQLREQVRDHALERGDGFVAAAGAFDLAGEKFDLRLQRGEIFAAGAGGGGAVDLVGEFAHQVFEMLRLGHRRVARRSQALRDGAVQLVEPIAEIRHLLRRGRSGERGVDALREAFDAALQSDQAFAAHAFGDDFANVGDDASNFRRRDAAAGRSLEPDREFVELALRAFAAVGCYGGAREEIAHFARLVENRADGLRVDAAARLEILDLAGDGAHVALERADRFARVEFAQACAQFARQLFDRRRDRIAHALDASDVKAVGDVVDGRFERGDGSARGEFTQAPRDGGDLTAQFGDCIVALLARSESIDALRHRRDLAAQLLDRMFGAVARRKRADPVGHGGDLTAQVLDRLLRAVARRALARKFRAHLFDAFGHAVDVALQARKSLRLRCCRGLGGCAALETLDNGSQARFEFARRAALVEGRARFGAARSEGKRRIAIEFALAAHDLRHGVHRLRSDGRRRLRCDGANGLALGALRHVGGELAELRLDARETIGVGAVAAAAFEMNGDFRQFGFDFAQTLVAAPAVAVVGEIVDAAFEPRERAADRLESGLVAALRHLLLDFREPARDRLQRFSLARAIGLRGFDDVGHFGERARRLVLAARIAPLVGFERVLDQAFGVFVLTPGDFAGTGATRQIAARAAAAVGSEILDAIVLDVAAAFLAAPAGRASAFAQPRQTRRHGVDIF